MARNSLVDIEIAPGILSEETARGSLGRYKDGEKIRFRNLLPEKLRGWILSSLGTGNGNIEHETNQFTGLGATFAVSATTITLESAVTVSDQDPVWLFGQSKTSGWGTRSISDAAAVEGAFIFDLDANVTAALADAIVIEYPDEFTGGVAVTSGGTEGSEILVLGSNITTYLKAGTIVRIALDGGGFQWTKTITDIVSGAATITLQEPLTDDVAAGTPVMLFCPESDIVDTTNNLSYVVRFLAAGIAADDTVRLTEALPADANGLDINIFDFEEVTADGDQTSTTSLSVSATTIENTDGSAYPASLVIVPSFQTLQTPFLGFARALHDWVDLDGEKWAAIGTDLKLYVVNNSQIYDITPIRTSGSLTDPFTTVLGDQTVTVAHAGHGEQVGNFVTYSGASAVGGLTLNGEFQVATVIDADSYTIEAAYPATAAASGGGTVAYQYDIDIGASGNQTITGWGTGPYGAGLYGHGAASGGIAERLRIWSLDNFGEDLLASPNASSLYYWDKTSGTATRAVLVDEAPFTIQRMLVSPEGRYVLAFGAGTGSADVPGDADKLLIRWPSSEIFTDWIPSTTNSAGDLRLDKGSEILTAVESRGDIIVFTDESLHALQAIGGTLVYGLRHLGQSVKIIGANAAVDVNGIVFFMAEGDFMIYDGVLRVLECEVRSHVYNDINQAQGDKVFASVNKLFTEVWWFYPSSTSETNDRYVKYNYKDGIWDYGTLARTAFHDSSAFLAKPYATQDGKLYQHETGVDAADGDGVLHPMTSYIETYDAEVEPGGEHIMHISRMIPDFKTLTGSIALTLTGREYPQKASSEVTKGPYTITSSTERQDLRMRARQVSFKIESDALLDDWRMGTWRARVRPHGRRGTGG